MATIDPSSRCLASETEPYVPSPSAFNCWYRFMSPSEKNTNLFTFHFLAQFWKSLFFQIGHFWNKIESKMDFETSQEENGKGKWTIFRKEKVIIWKWDLGEVKNSGNYPKKRSKRREAKRSAETQNHFLSRCFSNAIFAQKNDKILVIH